MFKSILLFLLAASVAIIQINFLPHFKFLAHINLILIGIAFITPSNYSLALKWAFVSGLLLDLNSIWPFGVFTLILLAITLEANFLFKNFLTNKSFYSFATLVFGNLLAYNFGLFILSCFFYWLKITPFYIFPGKIYFLSLLWQILANLIFAYLAYLVFSKTKLAEKFIR